MLSEGMIWLVRSCPYNAKSSFGTLCVKSTKMTMSVSAESAGDEEVLQAARKADHVRMAGRMQATDRRSRKSGGPINVAPHRCPRRPPATSSVSEIPDLFGRSAEASVDETACWSDGIKPPVHSFAPAPAQSGFSPFLSPR